MNKTSEILSFLKPIVLAQEIKTFQELDRVLIHAPKYTLLPQDFFEAALNYLPKLSTLKTGAWVSVGVWKGGGGLFLRALMNDLNINKPLYLIDTYGHIPIENIKHQKDITFIEHYSISKNSSITDYLTEVQGLFTEHNLQNQVNYILGDITKMSLDNLPFEIAFLHLDVDFFEPTFASLKLLYDRMMNGGVIIIDDYYLDLVNCKEAVDTFCFENNIDLNKVGKKFSHNSLLIEKVIS